MIKFSVHFTKIIAILLLLKHKSVYKVIFSQRGIKAKDVNTFSTTAKIKKTVFVVVDSIAMLTHSRRSFYYITHLNLHLQKHAVRGALIVTYVKKNINFIDLSMGEFIHI